MNGYPSKELSESLTDEALILKLKSAEHEFVERKSKTDEGGWLRTAVAFANSVPIGYPATLFVGVDDDGKPQVHATDNRSLMDVLEDLGKKLNGALEKAYPPIYRHPVPLHLPDGGCLAVIIPGSAERPHFAGQSYIRKGPETRPASEEQFGALIASRNSKIRELQKHLGKHVSIRSRKSAIMALTHVLVECNQWYLITEMVGTVSVRTAYPLSEIGVNFDCRFERLELVIP